MILETAFDALNLTKKKLSAELTVTRAYWRKQVLRHACQKSLKILPHTGGTCLRQCSRVTVSSADIALVCGRLYEKGLFPEIKISLTQQLSEVYKRLIRETL